jgi:hypothetical protein
MAARAVVWSHAMALGTENTLASGGAASMLCVTLEPSGDHATGLGPWRWDVDLTLADASSHTANFLVLSPGDGPAVTQAEAAAEFGTPSTVYHFEKETILLWHKNLLRDLGPATPA